ncbi:rifin PIR protein,putative [Plasmodium sp. DRC-Itaito]|nr:rifin PIR protein,putative [Plasmodium sp. DRC-Itaito]
MKLQYFKILLFFILLNILVTLYQAHNKYKSSIAQNHTRTTTSRVLSEGYTKSSIHNNDTDMKSVKENFERRTSQRLREYDKRMKDKRQKRNEQRDRNIQEIIEKDKMEKSLEQKIEKGCLKCGCALGGVAASVGLFGGLGVYGWKIGALAAAEKGAIAEVSAAMVDGAAKGAEAFKSAVIAGITEKFGVSIQGVQRFESLFTINTYPTISEIARAINSEYEPSSCISTLFHAGSGPGAQKPICTWWKQNVFTTQTIRGNHASMYKSIEVAVEKIVSNAEPVAETAAKKAIEDATATLTQQKASEIAATCMGHQTAIIASVVALLIIALVMIIIYLVLRYRRKKKINKKVEYTKLLNQ